MQQLTIIKQTIGTKSPCPDNGYKNKLNLVGTDINKQYHVYYGDAVSIDKRYQKWETFKDLVKKRGHYLTKHRSRNLGIVYYVYSNSRKDLMRFTRYKSILSRII